MFDKIFNHQNSKIIIENIRRGIIFAVRNGLVLVLCLKKLILQRRDYINLNYIIMNRTSEGNCLKTTY